MKNKKAKISESLKDIYRIVFQMNRLNLKLRDNQTLLHLAVNGVSPVDDFHTSDVCKWAKININQEFIFIKIIFSDFPAWTQLNF
jgi:hypothetical protein